MSDHKFYDDASLGLLLGADEATVAQWRCRYSWPHVKLGRQVRYTDADVRAIVAQHHVEGVKQTGLPGQTARSIARSR